MEIEYRVWHSIVKAALLCSLLVTGGCGLFGGGGPAPSDSVIPDSSSPSESTDTGVTPPIAMPSPPILEGIGQLVPDGTRLIVTGTVRREKLEESVVGVLVIVRNETTGVEIAVPVKEDGGFTAEIPVTKGDLITLKAKDPKTDQKSNVLESVIPETTPGSPTEIRFEDASKFDRDNDGVTDNQDAFILNSNETTDTNQNGLGDNADPDNDSDGVLDGQDNCPLVANPDQVDTDGDGQGNACDADDDNDGTVDSSDTFPLNPAEQSDTDSDGVGNNADNCPAVSNPDQSDNDSDGTGNACDPDEELLFPIVTPDGKLFFLGL